MSSTSLQTSLICMFLSTLFYSSVSSVHATPTFSDLAQPKKTIPKPQVRSASSSPTKQYFANGVVEFDTCVPNDDPTMCTVACVENENWGPYAVMYLYDHTCHEMSNNQHAPRSDMAINGSAIAPANPNRDVIGWKFTDNSLDFPLYVHVDPVWDALPNSASDDPRKQVTLGYKGLTSVPLLEDKWGLADYTNLWADGSGTWTYWRGQFSC